MSELSKRVVIAGRTYPLTVKREDEEGLEKASDLLNKIIKSYEENYAVKDRQDLLAMCLIHVATRLVQLEKKSSLSPIENQLKELEVQLSNYLEEEPSLKL